MWIATADAADADALRAAWEADSAVIKRDGHVVAQFGPGDFEALAAGEVIVRRVDAADGSTATGAILVPSEPPGPWIAIQDPYDRPLTRSAIMEDAPPDHEGGHAMWYLLDLPWPISDRQWVSEARNNGPLFASSGGRVWERYWDLQAPTTAARTDPSAIWVPVNHGSWLMIRVGGDTLAIFSARSTLGGALPGNMAVSYAMSTLKGLLQKVREHGLTQSGHYRAGHRVMRDPSGAEIPYWR